MKNIITLGIGHGGSILRFLTFGLALAPEPEVFVGPICYLYADATMTDYRRPDRARMRGTLVVSGGMC